MTEAHNRPVVIHELSGDTAGIGTALGVFIVGMLVVVLGVVSAGTAVSGGVQTLLLPAGSVPAVRIPLSDDQIADRIAIRPQAQQPHGAVGGSSARVDSGGAR